MGHYDTMQVCLNGHQITSIYDSFPNGRRDHCRKCGKKTIHRCQNCNEKIKGRYLTDRILDRHSIPTPDNCENCGKPYPWKSKAPKSEHKVQSDEFILWVFSKFSDVVGQLRKRHDERETLDVTDEYDVQDLLHSLLRLQFDDIRAEEWNPSYAGSSTRSDFLIKEEKIIIEAKHTRKGLTDKKLKEELIIDKEQYEQSSNCNLLYCFVYDPDKRITNPRGFEKDISEKSKEFECKVIITS